MLFEDFKVGDIVTIRNIQCLFDSETGLYSSIEDAIGISEAMECGDHEGETYKISRIRSTGYRYPSGQPITSIALDQVDKDDPCNGRGNQWSWCSAFLEYADNGFWKVNVFEEIESKQHIKTKLSVGDVHLKIAGVDVGCGIEMPPSWGYATTRTATPPSYRPTSDIPTLEDLLDDIDEFPY